MSILNYTTKIAATKTAAEIEARLVKAGALAVLKEYGPTGLVSAFSFRIRTAHGVVSIRMPTRIDGVLKVLTRKQSRVEARFRTPEQAERVAMRIAKDWLEAQLAVVESEMADLVEVFLPYAQTPSGQTVYASLEAKQLGMLALEGPKS